MNMNMKGLFLTGILLVMIFSLIPSLAFAHPHQGQIMINNNTHKPNTEIISLNPIMNLEKTTVSFYASEDNTLPWAFVEGKITNHVENYPVIIQIFKNNMPIHFAQTNVNNDGDYEYRFRVLNSDNGIDTKIFEGNYLVQIFKVVYSDPINLI